MLALDRWLFPNHHSIWNFTILTPTRKEYIVKLSDFSVNSYTAEFIAEKIEEIFNRISPSKFETIVSDNGSNVWKVREIIKKKYLRIKNIRCISHCINLISCDIV
jgi:hypothetical protein